MKRVKCKCCGGEIDWPPLDYACDAPIDSFDIPESELAHRVQQNRDIVIVDDQYFFIRGNVQIPIVGHSDTFAWGAWCSISRASFERINELWDDPEQVNEPPRFAWLVSVLPTYDESTFPLKARLHLRGPCVVPYIEVTPEHPLGQEQLNGITTERIEAIARAILGDGPPRCSRPV